MEITTISLKYGPMVITVEPTPDGFQRVARYTLTNHPNLNNKTLTSRSKTYKTLRGAANEAEKYSTAQVTR